VIVDPTDSFIVVPDLGADLLLVYSINKEDSTLTAQTPVQAPASSGPRHGVFNKLASNGKTYFYLTSELANTITGYEVTYEGGGLSFKEIFKSGALGDQTVPETAAIAECLVSVS
jgi:6-phosphogluconolactonase (cycloisomerase 2 family)